jgi:hypothetical protein
VHHADADSLDDDDDDRSSFTVPTRVLDDGPAARMATGTRPQLELPLPAPPPDDLRPTNRLPRILPQRLSAWQRLRFRSWKPCEVCGALVVGFLLGLLVAW